MRRMRTISQAAAYVRQLDPETALTETAIRRLVKQGKIPHLPAGTKQLVSLEDLESYIEGIFPETAGESKIRRIC